MNDSDALSMNNTSNLFTVDLHDGEYEVSISKELCRKLLEAFINNKTFKWVLINENIKTYEYKISFKSGKWNFAFSYICTSADETKRENYYQYKLEISSLYTKAIISVKPIEYVIDSKNIPRLNSSNTEDKELLKDISLINRFDMRVRNKLSNTDNSSTRITKEDVPKKEIEDSIKRMFNFIFEEGNLKYKLY